MSLGNRVVFIGDSEVGKTSIINRFIKKEFTQQNPTVGASFFTQMLSVNDQSIYMQIWDTAGQEKFRSIGPIYFRKSLAAVAVFDLTRKETLESLKSWIEEYRSYSDDKFVIVVGNKQDLESSITFNPGETTEWAKSMDAECIWVSAKTGYGIDDVFNILGEHLYHLRNTEKEPEVIVIPQEQCNPQQSSSCC